MISKLNEMRLIQMFDDMVGSELDIDLTPTDKIIMILEEIIKALEHKADENHQHTLI